MGSNREYTTGARLGSAEVRETPSRREEATGSYEPSNSQNETGAPNIWRIVPIQSKLKKRSWLRRVHGWLCVTRVKDI